MTGREQFESYYAREQLPCLSSVKERHWQTWLEAQTTLLSAHGPVTMLTMDNVAIMPSVVEVSGGGQRVYAEPFFKEREQKLIEDEINNADSPT